jgi:hypothetical protein
MSGKETKIKKEGQHQRSEEKIEVVWWQKEGRNGYVGYVEWCARAEAT